MIRRVAVIYNPISGSGGGPKLAEEVNAALQQVGLTVSLRPSEIVYNPDSLSDWLSTQDAVVIVGGDGTLRALLGALIRTARPVYFLPAGNESLFAKAFGFSASSRQVVQSIQRGEVEEHQVGLANGQPFFLMLSLGLDSCVIKELTARRAGTVSFSDYCLLTLKALLRYQPSKISLTVDGQKKIDLRIGSIIVANRSEYARGLLLVPEADSKSGCLRARFFPGLNRFGYLKWTWSVLRRKPIDLQGTLLFSGRSFRIENQNKSGETCQYPVQIDGEYLGETPVEITIAEKPLLVIK